MSDNSATTSAEIERKFEVSADTVLPDLSQLPGISGVRIETFELDATYFDTAALKLLGARMTLRRRRGGSDAGWHLKTPVSDGVRSETAVPLTEGDEVPDALANRVRAWSRSEPLIPVATLRTTRTIHELFGDDGRILVEVADDLVHSEAAGDPSSAQAWREWEAELKGGDDDDLAAVADCLLANGAHSASSASKLAQALSGRRPASFPRISHADPDDPAKVLVQAYLVAQVEALEFTDSRVRSDDEDSVHKMRVATRRLRSLLGTFRPVFDRTVTDPLREELKWLAGLLGVARDAEVQRSHFAEAIAAEDPDLVFGGIASWVDREFATAYRAGHDAVLQALDSERYFRLLDALDHLVLDPPWSDAAELAIDDVLVKRVHRAYRRLRRQIGTIDHSTDTTERDHRFHESRKQAKKLRYAAEAVELAYGTRAGDLADAAEDVQEVLGAHQDSVVARQELRRLSGRAFLDGENTFTLGRLHAAEEQRAAEAETEFRPLWQKLRKLPRFPR